MFNRLKSLFGGTSHRSTEQEIEPPALAAPVEQRSTSRFASLHEELAFEILGAAYRNTISGIAINPRVALRCSPVFLAHKVLSETLAELPLKLYRKQPDGGRKLAEDHPLYWLLTDAPNAWTPASEFKMAMTGHWVLHGNAYAFASRNRDGMIEEIVQCEEGSVTVDCDKMTGEPIYRFTDRTGAQREYNRSAIIHFRTAGGPVKGLSPIEHGREAIALAMVMERHAPGLFGNGAKPGGALKHPKKLGDKQVIDNLRQQVVEKTGPENPGGFLVLEDGMDWVQFALTSSDAQFLELRQMAVLEILRLWRIPPHMAGELDRTTHSNAEELGQQFLSLCLLPILRLFQDAIEITCLTANERKTLFVEFLVDDLARANLAARYTAFSQAVASGILNPNECRALDNRSPYAGGEVFTRPVNSAPVENSLNRVPTGAAA